MTISSIHFQKAEVEFAEKHNFRTEKKEPEYLLDKQYRKTNEYLKLYDPKELYQEQLKLRTQTVYQFLHTIFPTFDKNNPKQSMKNIYLAWKAQHQKSSITPQKRSQSDESTHERVEVHQTSQSQSMSKFEALEPKEKLYTVQGLGYMTAEQIRAEAQSDDIGHFTSEEFKRALTADEFREVFGEPQQAPQQKQSLFARVRHSLER